MDRYNTLHADIHFALNQGKTYPWALLMQLKAGKFFSDLVEAVFGALFIDFSRGYDEMYGLCKTARHVRLFAPHHS